MAIPSATEKPPYARLGGYDVIAAMVDKFSQTLQPNPQMARFSAGMNLERRKRNRQLTLDYLCVASGGPTLYVGQDYENRARGSRNQRQRMENRDGSCPACDIKAQGVGQGR